MTRREKFIVGLCLASCVPVGFAVEAVRKSAGPNLACAVWAALLSLIIFALWKEATRP